jgi:hypothetical protein
LVNLKNLDNDSVNLSCLILGDAETDVFFGRLDNQEVTLGILLQRVLAYGPVVFIRLCNRLVSRIDNSKLQIAIIFKLNIF